jgi:multisubunit Na+/H+ antiporter MnhB subunit
MKAILLVLLWCVVAFLSLLTLYKVVTPEMQYAMAEHFKIYGDELIMDFVLYVFLGAAIFIASIFTLVLYLIIRKNNERRP